MKIGWVRDFTLAERPGGAQVCEKLLKEGAPAEAQLVECPPGSVSDDVDAYIALRCQQYSIEEIQRIVSKPCFHWAMDYWEWGNFEQRDIMFKGARDIIFGSPLHKSTFVNKCGLGQSAGLLPYPMDVEHWLSLRKRANNRHGAMWYGEGHPYKGIDITVNWATQNKIHLDVYGIGIQPQRDPENPFVQIHGFIDEGAKDLALASHEIFAHFPRAPEGFCYALMEAWLSGLRVIYSGRIGLDSWGKSWEDLAENCYRAPERFWMKAQQCLS